MPGLPEKKDHNHRSLASNTGRLPTNPRFPTTSGPQPRQKNPEKGQEKGKTKPRAEV
jgi:hypothetical protein